MTKRNTHAVLAMLASAMVIGAATPSLASDDDNDQILGSATASTAARGYYSQAYSPASGPMFAFAYKSGPTVMGPGFNGDIGNDVFVNGVYVGSDPDPRIRASIRAEERGNDSGNSGGNDD